MTQQNLRRLTTLLLGIALFAETGASFAKGYSSGGHSYSSHSSSSSHSFSSGSSHGFSSGSSRSSGSSSTHSSSFGFGSGSHSGGSSTRTFSSGSGKSYTSGSSVPGDRKGYSSSKSYSSGGGSTTFYSGGSKSSGSSASKPPKTSTSSSGSGFTFDAPAAHARKEEASRSDFSKYKESRTPPVISHNSGSDYSGRPPPIPSTTRTYTRSYTRTVYVPDYTVIRTRPSRINIYFGSYAYRPWVYYNDS
jgi:hypothetical protein